MRKELIQFPQPTKNSAYDKLVKEILASSSFWGSNIANRTTKYMWTPLFINSRWHKFCKWWKVIKINRNKENIIPIFLRRVMERCRYSAERVVIKLQFASITHWRTLNRVDAMGDHLAWDKQVLGDIIMQFLFYLGLPHGLASEETNSFILCACFCFTTGPTLLSREISRRPMQNNNFHWKILIFTDLKKFDLITTSLCV